MLPDTSLAQVLAQGPVTGGVTASSAKVFVRTDQPASVFLRYGTDPKLATYLDTPAVQTEEASDFTTIIPLTALTAETTYYMNVYVNGVPQFILSAYPSFTSFAPNDVSRDFKFVILTDFTNVQALDRTTTTFASAAAELPVFAFIGGDFDHRNPTNLNAKRIMFQSLYDAKTPFMSGFAPLILQKIPFVHQWDDHDAGQNNLDRTYPSWNLSQQAYDEYVPSYPLPSVVPGIWQKFSYAQVECFVLDCRSQRDPEDDPDDANKSMLDGNNLGENGELSWLENGLLSSQARWKIIFTSVIVNPTTKVPDGWGGYQTEWNALKAFINEHGITNIVFVSGDLHLGSIDNGIAAGFPEMCVAAANSMATDPHCATAGTGVWSEGYFENPCSGYGVVSVLQDPDRLVLEAVDETGMIRVAYTVSGAAPTPTPTPTPTATPTPTPMPPSITTQPKDAKVAVGAKAKFTVRATGSLPLGYQWAKNSVDISGATSPTYVTPPVTPADDGAIFTVTVSNPDGSVVSNPARLRVR